MKKFCMLVLVGEDYLWDFTVLLTKEQLEFYTEIGAPVVEDLLTPTLSRIRYRLFPPGKLYVITVPVGSGDDEITFLTYQNPRRVKKVKEDGIEQITEVVNVVPRWVVDKGLARIWIFFQDLFNFRWRDLFINKTDLLTAGREWPD